MKITALAINMGFLQTFTVCQLTHISDVTNLKMCLYNRYICTLCLKKLDPCDTFE